MEYVWFNWGRFQFRLLLGSLLTVLGGGGFSLLHCGAAGAGKAGDGQNLGHGATGTETARARGTGRFAGVAFLFS